MINRLLLLLILSQVALINLAQVQYGTPFSNVPNAKDAVIYQVNMRCFSQAGNFQGVIDRLDEIKALGVNVIYLMPIYPVGTLNSVNSPYCIKDFKGIAPEFGNLDDLRNLVDGAHNRDMAVILDFVANHSSWDHPWMENEYWYKKDNWGNIESPNGWMDVAQFDFNNYDLRGAVLDAIRYWIFEANIDGYRFDYVDGPPVDYWQQVISNLRGIDTHKLLLLAEGDGSEYYNAGFDITYGMATYNHLRAVHDNNEPVYNFDHINWVEFDGASNNQTVARYLTNHDLNDSDGSAAELFGGNQGALSTFIGTTFMKGIPYIYNGQEVGTYHRLTFPFTSTKINWNSNPEYLNEYKDVMRLWNNNDALRQGSIYNFTNWNIAAFTKSLGAIKFLVLANMRSVDKYIDIPASVANEEWYDALTGESIDISTFQNIEAYEYKILSNPRITIIESILEKQVSNIEIYPNPVTQNKINIDLPKNIALPVKYSILDLLGKEIYSSVLKNSGSMNIDLRKGTYLIKMQNMNESISKIIIIE